MSAQILPNLRYKCDCRGNAFFRASYCGNMWRRYCCL